ncbi:hypothetical protein CPB83DRAFT_900311 [Crepidotus variabilis]|uniref:Uncharacterized protein n=1 Tax=Crepidotus variabilis TaxID=179855 RepID=A0A9P6JI12_9AGAR|nr:hypothetical protein CPB83DRAFT_900311 [Crepidotus variabilis]
MSSSGSVSTDTIPLFRQAFAATDPVSSLLHLLNDASNERSICDLLFAYTDEIDENPYQAQALTSILLKLRHQPTPEIPRFSQGLRNLIYEELGDRLFKREPDVMVYGPKNEHLLDALIVGLSYQHDLAAGGDELAVLQEGLNAIRDGSEKSQVLVVGACIQLLMGGHVILTEDVGTYRMTAEEITMKLKSRKRCVTDPQAIEVVDLAISHAESGLKQENNLEDVWSILFPRVDLNPLANDNKNKTS